MILLLHIGIALFSVAFAAFGLIIPSKTKLKISLGLVTATIATGTYLVVMAPAHMLSACMAGLFYLAVIIVLLAFTQRKIALKSAQAVRTK